MRRIIARENQKIEEDNMKLQKTALALLVGWYAANATAYSEQGQAGNTKSWESAEYLKDWGLTSMNASTAYALGFNGSGVKIGVMDSGVLLNHPEISRRSNPRCKNRRDL